MTDREREVIAALLGEGTPSAATARWLKTAAGRAAAAGYRRALRALDAWGTATAHPAAAAADAVYYDRVPTPLGHVFAAIGRRGLVRVSFERSERRFVAELARRYAGPLVRSRRRLFAIRRALVDYRRGRSGRLAVAVDLAGVSPFQRRVLAPRGASRWAASSRTATWRAASASRARVAPSARRSDGTPCRS